MKIQNQFLIILLVITFFNLFILPLEYYITNVALVVYTIHPHVNILIFIFFVMLANLMNVEKIKMKTDIYLITILFIFLINLVFFKIANRMNLFNIDDPLIYEYFPREGYQAEIISLKGKNYFPTWKKGKVLLNNKELNIINWSENLIIAEQPVFGEFGTFELEVVRIDGKRSNKVYFKVKDPSLLPK